MHFHEDIVKLARENNYFRKVIVTGAHSQVVLMSVASGDEIGEEAHQVDQILFFVEGTGKAVIDDEEYEVVPHDMIVVKSGTRRNIINTHPQHALKLVTVYAPPEHEDATVHVTKADALATEE